MTSKIENHQSRATSMDGWMDTKTCIETCNAVYIEFNLQSLDWQMLTVTDCPVIFLNIHDLMKKDTNSPPNKPLRKICLLLIKYLFHEDPAFKSSIICNEKEIIWKGPTLHEKRSDITWLRSVFRWLCHWHVICLDNRPIQKKNIIGWLKVEIWCSEEVFLDQKTSFDWLV